MALALRDARINDRPPRRMGTMASQMQAWARKRSVAWPLLATLTACGGGGDDHGSNLHALMTTVGIAPAVAAVTTRQPLNVAVSVTAGGGDAMPAGSVTLTSGAFSSGLVPVIDGAAIVTVPAGVLPIGSDALTVRFEPGSGDVHRASSATSSVTVTQALPPTLTAQSTSFPTDGHPFDALPVGGNLLVSVSANGKAGSNTGIRVMALASPGAPSYRCTQVASHPGATGSPLAFGLATTPGGGLALAIDDAGVDLLDAYATASGCDSAETIVSQGDLSTAQGSFAVAVTPDGRFAFVANEYGVVAKDSAGADLLGNVGVVALAYDAGGRLARGRLVGRFSTGGQAVTSVTLSPDGSRLYVTSEIAHPGIVVAGTGNATIAHGGCAQTGTDANGNPVTSTSTYGLLSIIDTARAETTPDAGAIIATVAAGCGPVRVVETADQQVLWVAARGDHNVLAFSANMLETRPDSALLGFADTGGAEPVGLQLFRGDQLLAVANSNRFASPPAVGNMTILAATPVLPSLVRTVPALYFPRSIHVATDDATLYLTDYDSATVQIISTGGP